MKLYFKILLFLILVKSDLYLFSQNLIPNGSFEIIGSCPTLGGQLYFAHPWKNPSNIGDPSRTPDIFNSCTHTGVGVPVNMCGYQYAKSGSGYAGFGCYASYMHAREYIEVKLNDSLRQGEKYKIKFYVNLSNYSAYAIDCIAAYFSKEFVVWNSNLSMPVTPQIKSVNSKFLSDTLNWMLVEGDLIAKGGEQFIVIGNFNSDSATNKILVNDPMYGGAYYYIDDVSAYKYSEPLITAEAGDNVSICLGEGTQIGSPATVNYTYHWKAAEGISDTLTAQPIVTPTHTTTYYLTQFDYMENETRDSVTVNVDPCIDELIIPNAFTPNNDGYNDKFVIRNTKGWMITLTIYNRWGKKIYESLNYENDWNSGGAPDGVYYYTLHAKAIEGVQEERYGSIEILR